jgi:hypothetical protein
MEKKWIPHEDPVWWTILAHWEAEEPTYLQELLETGQLKETLDSLAETAWVMVYQGRQGGLSREEILADQLPELVSPPQSQRKALRKVTLDQKMLSEFRETWLSAATGE